MCLVMTAGTVDLSAGTGMAIEVVLPEDSRHRALIPKFP